MTTAVILRRAGITHCAHHVVTRGRCQCEVGREIMAHHLRTGRDCTHRGVVGSSRNGMGIGRVESFKTPPAANQPNCGSGSLVPNNRGAIVEVDTPCEGRIEGQGGR